jgi:hypothetical protein
MSHPRNEVIQWVKEHWGKGVSNKYLERGIVAISMPLILSTYEWTSNEIAMNYSKRHPEHTFFWCTEQGLIPFGV